MKRYIKASSDTELAVGDVVTILPPSGYAAYDTTIESIKENSNGVLIAWCSDRESHPLSSLIKSKKAKLYSLTREEITTPEFVATLTYRGDSLWCQNINVPRVDRDNGIENLVGMSATIHRETDCYRIIIVYRISKHYDISKEYKEEYTKDINAPIIQEALDIIKSANEIILDYGRYQRIFK